MNNIKQKDLKTGAKGEEEVYAYLSNLFSGLKRTKDNVNYGKYFEFDYYTDEMFIELKTRNITLNQYPTLMFGKNKFLKGEELLKENPDLDIIYLFNLKDGLYYWTHNSSAYTTKYSGRCDRGKKEYTECIHVETKYFKKI